MSVFVGIDGGATRTTVLVVNHEGHALARLEGAIALVRQQSAAEVAASLSALVQNALRQADRTHADVLCAGLTGVGRSAERDEVTKALAATNIADHVIVTTDAEVALFDAFGTGPGIVLIAGTGSVAWGRSASGEARRVGGWGPLLGDGGSAYAVGLAALRATASAEDEMGQPTLMRAAVLEATHQNDTPSLIRWADRAGRAKIAGLAPCVLEQAPADAVARSIVEDATLQLSAHASALARLLAPWPAGYATIALGGGLLQTGRTLREHLRMRIEQAQPPMRVLDIEIDGARGAASIARVQQANEPESV